MGAGERLFGERRRGLDRERHGLARDEIAVRRERELEVLGSGLGGEVIDDDLVERSQRGAGFRLRRGCRRGAARLRTARRPGRTRRRRGGRGWRGGGRRAAAGGRRGAGATRGAAGRTGGAERRRTEPRGGGRRTRGLAALVTTRAGLPAGAPAIARKRLAAAPRGSRGPPRAPPARPCSVERERVVGPVGRRLADLSLVEAAAPDRPR